MAAGLSFAMLRSKLPSVTKLGVRFVSKVSRYIPDGFVSEIDFALLLFLVILL